MALAAMLIIVTECCGSGLVLGLTNPGNTSPGHIPSSVDVKLCECRLPPAERRGYSSVFNALYRITTEEGLLTLWRVCISVLDRNYIQVTVRLK